jgi:hypothetical protein
MALVVLSLKDKPMFSPTNSAYLEGNSLALSIMAQACSGRIMTRAVFRMMTWKTTDLYFC